MNSGAFAAGTVFLFWAAACFLLSFAFSCFAWRAFALAAFLSFLLGSDWVDLADEMEPASMSWYFCSSAILSSSWAAML